METQIAVLVVIYLISIAVVHFFEKSHPEYDTVIRDLAKEKGEGENEIKATKKLFKFCPVINTIVAILFLADLIILWLRG